MRDLTNRKTGFTPVETFVLEISHPQHICCTNESTTIFAPKELTNDIRWPFAVKNNKNIPSLTKCPHNWCLLLTLKLCCENNLTRIKT